MLATIIIELGLAGWILARYTLHQPRRIILALLVGLAGFQMAEYGVCGGAEGTLVWSRIGYILITMLPALGLHLISTLLGRPRTILVWTIYAIAGSLATILAVVPATLNSSICTGNYTVFRLSEPFSTVWSYYYTGAVLVGLVVATVSAGLASSTKRRALGWLALGYASFIGPTLIIYYSSPGVRAGIPSIMCGFAVILALILGLKIAPLTNRS
jgi:hypothetical protein